MNEIKNESNVGQIQIADEVIAIIAGTAALEIEGVAAMASNLTGGFSDILGKKNLSKGVKIEVLENDVNVSINVLLKFGVKLQDVSVNIQKRVKTAVETMTGLNVVEVNVLVSGVLFEKESVSEGQRKTEN